MVNTSRAVTPIPFTPHTRGITPPSDDAATTGFIVVRLSNRYPPRPGETLIDLARSHGELAELGSFLNERELTESSYSVTTVPPERLLEWEREASTCDGLAPTRSLLQYWRVDARAATQENPSVELERLAAELKQRPGVDTAYLELDATPPGFSFNPTDDDDYPQQTYVNAPVDPADPTKPGGIHATAIWDLGYYGEDVGLVDVERGWFLDHLDLKARGAGTIAGDKTDLSSMSHGTAVLGICAAVDNDIGIVGIAPDLKSVTVASVLRATKGVYMADAIVNAIDHSVPGDVILLELETNESGSHYPAESVDDAFDAILLASALGRIVVEAAGNGYFDTTGIDLDAYTTPGGQHVFDRNVRDSGAILVGASHAGPGYVPLESSNFGSRVDCFAPGEGIETCDYAHLEDGDARSTYQPNFGGTSAASAIVAGAAVLLQSAWLKRTGALLSPLQMRGLLSDPAINWPQGSSPKHIGVLPDLGAIIDAELPDIYLRDTINDDGTVPSTGTLSMSPDIIVRAAPVVNPGGTFGEGTGTEQDVALSDPIAGGSDYYLYARVRNRGPVDAPGATVSFYWSPPSTLVTPDQWNFIGTTAAFNVPLGGALTVSNAVTWPQAKLPAAGHYCFVAVANQPQDLAPPLPNNLGTPAAAAAVSWDSFLSLVRNNNNITWRNFDVIGVSASSLAPIVLDFEVVGPPDHARAFTIQVQVPTIPVRRVILRVPAVLGSQLRHPGHNPNQREDFHDIDLTPMRGLRAQRVVLSESARHKCSIILEPPFGDVRRHSRLVISQSFKGLEVGRITWELAAQTP
jgi:serine protease